MTTQHTPTLIDRLNSYQRDDPAEVVWEAAERIAELEAALRMIAEHPREQPIPQLIVRFQRIARAALAKVQA